MAILLAYKPLKRPAGITILGVSPYLALRQSSSQSLQLIIFSSALFLLEQRHGQRDCSPDAHQLGTPDEMRGRVNAVDMVIIVVLSRFTSQYRMGVLTTQLV